MCNFFGRAYISGIDCNEGDNRYISLILKESGRLRVTDGHVILYIFRSLLVMRLPSLPD